MSRYGLRPVSTVFFHVIVSVLALVGPLHAGNDFAQEQAPPASNGDSNPGNPPSGELPEVVIEQPQNAAKEKPSDRKAGSKSKQPVSGPGVEAQSSTASEASGGPAGDPGPGLNLNSPTKTGSRLGLTPLETPASVEVISGETVRERGQTSVNQAITQNAAGFTSTASPGNGGTGLATRGFAGHGSIMQLYDGTRLYVGAGTVTFPFDTWSAERIEVLRGPASVLYGEGAIGGVINVVPKKPTDYFTHEGEIAVGTDATKRFGVGSGGPISDQLSYRFDASGIESDSWLNEEGDFSSLVLTGALTYRPTSDLKLTISHDYADQSPLRYWGTPLIDGKIPDNIRFKSFNVSDSEVHYLDNWTQFKTEWNPTARFGLRNVAYRLTSNRHWRDVEEYDFQESGPNAGLVLRNGYLEIFHDQEQIGDRLDATFRTALSGRARNELLVGFDVNRIDFRHTNNFDDDGESFVDPFNFEPGLFQNPGGTFPKFDTDTRQYSFFAEDRLTVSKELSLVAGIRLDRPSMERVNLVSGARFEKDFSDVTWRAGAVYTPIPHLAFYGQYSTGVDTVGGLITLNQFNSQFDLATGRQIEIGVKQSFWHGLGEWTLAGYDIEKKNLLSRDPNNSQIVRQVGQQSSRGVEASLALQLTDTLRYEGNVALLQALYDDFVGPGGVVFTGNRPNNVPEQVVNNWLTWEFLPRWQGYVGVQWVGPIYSDDENLSKRPDFTVVNFGLSYDVTEKSEIALRVFNAFDELYATGGGTTQWQLAPPRSAELGYRIKY
jgi:iron complex outermembrane receptor protein